MKGNAAKQVKANTRGSAGGTASDKGGDYAAAITAWASLNMLTHYADLPWGVPQDCQITAVECQGVAEIDDIIATLSSGGYLYFQAKYGLRMGNEFNKALDQLVRAFFSANFNPLRDRLIIVTDSTASGTVRQLAEILDRFLLSGSNDVTLHHIITGMTSEEEKNAWQQFYDRVMTCWKNVSPEPDFDEDRFCTFLKHSHIFIIDPRSGNDAKYCIERIRRDLLTDTPETAWQVMKHIGLEMSSRRLKYSRAALLQALDQKELTVTARLPDAGQIDRAIAALQQKYLSREEKLDATTVFIPRASMDNTLQAFISDAARVMIFSGESGKGKTSWCRYTCQERGESGYLLIPADYLAVQDSSLFATLARLLQECDSKLSAAQILPRLEQLSMVFVIDGLDRVPSAVSERLSQWFERSLQDITSTPHRLILTTRPESLHALVQFSRLPVIYKNGSHYAFPVDDFSEDEAHQVATLLGDKNLAKYRHPGMMLFCHNLNLAESEVTLNAAQIVQRYTAFLTGRIAGQSGLLHEQVEYFLARMGTLLEESPDGLLTKAQAFKLIQLDSSCYQATKRSNLLCDINGNLRVDPDSVSEYLQGQQLDVPRTLSRLDEICHIPLKLGALRSRLEHETLACNSAISDWLWQMVHYWKDRQNDELLLTLCHILADMPQQSLVAELLPELTQSWRNSNLYLHLSPGRELLTLIVDKNLSARQQLDYLWPLSVNESGYDWRRKHWLTPEYAPNYYITPWRTAMQAAICADKEAGLTFLLAHFTDQTPFSDTDEAVMGDLAQGLFFLCVGADIGLAFTLLERAQRYGMIQNLAQRQQPKVLEALPTLIDNDGLDVVTLGVIFNALLEMPPAVMPQALTECLSPLLGDERYRDIVLPLRRLLALSGDHEQSAWLLQQSLPAYVDYSLITRFSGEKYRQLLTIAFDNIISGRGESASLACMGYQLDYQQLALTMEAIMAFSARDSGFGSQVATLVEAMLYSAYQQETLPPGFSQFIVSFFRQPVLLINIIYACTGHDGDEHLTGAGAGLRRALLTELSEYIHDRSSVMLMAENLIQRHQDLPFIARLIARLQQRCLETDIFADLKHHAWMEERVGAVESAVAAYAASGDNSLQSQADPTAGN